MGQRRSVSHRVVGLAWLVASQLLACASPGSQPIVGPDGSPMAHVHCGTEQGLCFRIAGELCPSGYEMTPVLTGSDGNFLVRCRDARNVATATDARALGLGMAPGRDAWPLMYPWPPAETSAAATRGQVTPAAKAPRDLEPPY